MRWLLPAALLLCACPRLYAQAPLAADLARAESLYVQGAYNEVTRLLSSAVGQEAPPSQAAATYRLLILSLMKQEALPEARLMVVRLLDHLPDYVPDPVQDPPDFVALVANVQILLLSPPETGSCDEALLTAEGRYVEGAFKEAAQVLTECLNRHLLYLEEEQVVRSLRLLVLAHLHSGALPEARQSVLTLLEHAPAYTPDPVLDPPAYTAFVNLVRKHRDPIDVIR